MIKINIFIVIALLYLTKADAQSKLITVSFPSKQCEDVYIPKEYLHQTLYACADANALPEGIDINFTVEDNMDFVNKMSMRLYGSSANGCFTYFPKNQQLIMCFNSSTTDIKQVTQKINITRAIYYGNIKYMDLVNDDQVWPTTYPMTGYKQINWRATQVYTAVKGETIKINYVIQYQAGYIVELTIEEEQERPKIKKWKQNHKDYLINESLYLTNTGKYVEFVAPKDLSFRVYFYTFAPIANNRPKYLEIMAKIISSHGDSSLKRIP